MAAMLGRMLRESRYTRPRSSILWLSATKFSSIDNGQIPVSISKWKASATKIHVLTDSRQEFNSWCQRPIISVGVALCMYSVSGLIEKYQLTQKVSLAPELQWSLIRKNKNFKLQKVMKTNLYIVNVVTCKLAKIQDEILSIMGYTKLTIWNKICRCENIHT
jgi:hypothetical protein